MKEVELRVVVTVRDDTDPELVPHGVCCALDDMPQIGVREVSLA